MKLRLKVCGMRDPANILEVASLNPHYMGFIYYSQSPRFVSNNFQVPEISSSIKRVGVFVDHPIDFILAEVNMNKLDAVQLHGDESPELCAQIKSKGIQVIKTFSVDQDFNFSITGNYHGIVDFFLFDTKGNNYGGTGRKFDWARLDEYTLSTPFFLSGGLSQENILQIATIKNPVLFGLDLNSGVEESPGIKSKSRIEKVIQLLNEIN